MRGRDAIDAQMPRHSTKGPRHEDRAVRRCRQLVPGKQAAFCSSLHVAAGRTANEGMHMVGCATRPEMSITLRKPRAVPFVNGAALKVPRFARRLL